MADPADQAKGYQVGGNHYFAMAVQPWEVVDGGPIEHAVGFYRWSALKYIMRAGSKGEMLEDIRKAQHYLAKLSAVLEAEQ